MEQKLLSQPSPQTAAEYEVAIDQCLEEMKRLQERMVQDQTEIDRLKAETRALLASMKVS
jgi:hypothetical protein